MTWFDLGQLHILAPLLVLLVVVGLLWLQSRLAQARRRRLVATWGGRSPRADCAISDARRLDELRPEESADQAFVLDDRTWIDLDLDDVFLRLDHCLTPIGSQTLYRQLHRLHTDWTGLRRRQDIVAALRDHPSLCGRIQLALLDAADQDAARIVELLWREPPPLAAIGRLAPLLLLATVAIMTLAWLGIVPWGLILPVFLVNSLIHFAHRRRIEGLPLASLGALVATASRLSRLDDAVLGNVVTPLRPAVTACVGLQRRLAPLLLDDGFGLAMYVKILFLVDVLSYASAYALIRRRSPELRQLFDAVGTLDAALALATFRAANPVTCGPELLGDADESPTGWRLDGAWHILTNPPTANDFCIHRRAALITGSNMSGKTTFLKTIGVSVVLAQTIGFALARRYRLPVLHVVTSIGRSDNLIEGRSYYQSEVESVLRLVRAAEAPESHLLLADELFRGTNPEERIAAAAEVLLFLARGHHLVLAATHDLDLVRLLATAYDCYHFADALDATGLDFDYTIRPGAATTRNAIRLLEHTGYPAEIVAGARRRMTTADQ